MANFLQTLENSWIHWMQKSRFSIHLILYFIVISPSLLILSESFFSPDFRLVSTSLQSSKLLPVGSTTWRPFSSWRHPTLCAASLTTLQTSCMGTWQPLALKKSCQYLKPGRVRWWWGLLRDSSGSSVGASVPSASTQQTLPMTFTATGQWKPVRVSFMITVKCWAT